MLIQFPSGKSSYTANLLNPDKTILTSYYVPSQGNQQRIPSNIVDAIHIMAIAGQVCEITKS